MEVTSRRTGKFALAMLAASGLSGCGLAPTQPTTIWTFLGIPQTQNMVFDNRVNRNGNVPQRERQPPLLRIADPANLQSPNPAIKKAAEIKAQKDLKCQKVKAIKYLATIGCGCYNKDKGVTKALLAAMDDCDEEVRLAAVQAIQTTATEDACPQCGQHSCCSKEVTEQLAKMATETDETGCWLEPSERVREAARSAMCICCPNEGVMEQLGPISQEPVPVKPPDEPKKEVPTKDDSTKESPAKEEPSKEEPNKAAAVEANDTSEAAESAKESAKVQEQTSLPYLEDFGKGDVSQASSQDAGIAPGFAHVSQAEQQQARPVAQDSVRIAAAPAVAEAQQPDARQWAEAAQPAPVVQQQAATAVQYAPPAAESIPVVTAQAQVVPQAAPVETVQPAPVAAPRAPASMQFSGERGMIQYVDHVVGTAHVEMANSVHLPKGTRLMVYHRFVLGRIASVGELEVMSSTAGSATVRAVGQFKISKVASGDEVVVTSPNL